MNSHIKEKMNYPNAPSESRPTVIIRESEPGLSNRGQLFLGILLAILGVLLVLGIIWFVARPKETPQVVTISGK